MRQWLQDIFNSIEPETIIRGDDGEFITSTYDRSQIEGMLEEINDRFNKNDEMRLGEKAAAEKKAAEAISSSSAQKFGKDVKLSEYRNENKQLKESVREYIKALGDIKIENDRLKEENELYKNALISAGLNIPILDSDEKIAMDATKLVWEGPLSFVDDDVAKEELLDGITKLLNRRLKLDEYYLA